MQIDSHLKILSNVVIAVIVFGYCFNFECKRTTSNNKERKKQEMVQAASTFLVGDDANWMKAESDKNVLVTGKNLAKHINTTAKQFLPVSPNGVLILIAKLLIWKSAPSEKH